MTETNETAQESEQEEMAGNGKLSPRQCQAVAALMVGGTVVRAAKICKVSERQLYRWLDDADFRAELARAGQEAIDGAVRQLADTAGIAIITLRNALTDKGAPFGVKVRAADVVLSRLLSVKELAEFERRLTALESLIGGTR